MVILLVLALSAPVRAEVVVSLGDSYSSGEGSRDASHSRWDSATRSWPLGDGCHRGPNAWPRLIGVTATRHFACSGAKVADLVSRGQKDRGPDDVPQLARLRSLDARTEVDTVLLTIGGNDMDFSGKIKACYLGHKCLRDLDKLDRDLAGLRRKLIAAYSQIAAATSADVVVVGYPDIFPARDERFHGCGWLGENPQRGTHEKTGVWHLEDGLDRTLQAAARAAEVDFIAIRAALDGHELCTEESFVNPIRPALNSDPGHPNARGQRLIAHAVEQGLADLFGEDADGTATSLARVADVPNEPVLGSPDYVVNGGGFGTYAPSAISNGGVPSGTLDDIKWHNWGKPVARGEAKAAIYRPQGQYYRPVRASVRAKDLSTCPGHPEQAYTTLLFRVPQWPGGPLGPWLKWSGSKTICAYDDTDPAYVYPAQPRGLCGSIGENREPGDLYSIEAFKITCRNAREVARRVGKRDWPFRCVRHGCSTTIRRLSCRLDKVHAGETTGFSYPYPVQRVACHRRSGTLSAWFVLAYD